jgi:hypothetical protein
MVPLFLRALIRDLYFHCLKEHFSSCLAAQQCCRSSPRKSVSAIDATDRLQPKCSQWTITHAHQVLRSAACACLLYSTILACYTYKEDTGDRTEPCCVCRHKRVVIECSDIHKWSIVSALDWYWTWAVWTEFLDINKKENGERERGNGVKTFPNLKKKNVTNRPLWEPSQKGCFFDFPQVHQK